MGYTGKRRFWASAVSKRRWALYISLWVTAVTVCLLLLARALWVLPNHGANAWQLQLKAIDSDLIISTNHWPTSSITPNVLIANSPQLIFSFLYFAYNSLLTAMCAADEWSRLSVSRKGLRVSNNPRVAQRSNYFLSVPYRYAIPLLIASAVLHWLISESIFVVAVEAYDSQMKRTPSGDAYNCAYSLVAMVSGIAVALSMFISLVGLGFRKFVSPMPVVGSNSLAIAAACHPTLNDDNLGNEQERDSEQDDEDMSLLPVQWGALPETGPIGHCTFTSRDVDFPEKGKKYQ